MRLEAHLNELAAPEAAAFRALAARLRTLPERVPPEDLTGRILAAVEEERSRKRAFFRTPAPWWGAAAAVAAAGVIAAVSLINPPDPAGSDPDSGIAWLAANQEADGTWDPSRHGGAAEYRPALTALAALALARTPEAYAENIRRACAALAALQTTEGAFGGTGRAQLYNQAITTYALASLYARRAELKPVLDRAVGFIGARQSAAGGWDYEADSEGNAAVTAWQVRALACAGEQGVALTATPLRKGLRWLRGSTRGDGSVAYHRASATRSDSLTALAAYALITAGKAFPQLPELGRLAAASLSADSTPPAGADCYRDYAKVLAFDSAGSAQQADTVRRQMAACASAGSPDQWATVGGRLYTTALTALAAK